MNSNDLIGKHRGWAKVAWSQGYYYLRRITEDPKVLDYKKILRAVIHSGGDTDTNACIVGGMLGSIIGVSGLPAEYLKKCLDVDLLKTKVEREAKYHPREGFNIVYKLFKAARKML